MAAMAVFKIMLDEWQTVQILIRCHIINMVCVCVCVRACVCVGVLQAVNTVKVMSSQSVNLFPGQDLSFKQLTSTCAHTFISN